MRVLANENVPRSAIEALRARGHDVVWARTDLPGADDETILQVAQREERVVVTQDKDFGELAFHYGLPASCGVVLFRLQLPGPEAAARRICAALEERDEWTGVFAVIEEGRTRTRPLPPSRV
jgi:predicted nuclease of predicted toxin-antitoxin system